MLQDARRAQPGDDIPRIIPSRDGAARAEQQDIASRETIPGTGGVIGEVIAGDAQAKGRRAILLPQRAQGIGVDIADLARRQLIRVGRQQLIATAQDAQPRRPHHINAADAQRQQRADILGAQASAGRHDQRTRRHIFARLYDILARRHRPQRLDLLVRRGLRVFEHDHSIRPVWQHAAGVDHQRLARLQVQRGPLAHGQFAARMQESWQALAGAEGIAGAQGIAIDGALAECGNGFAGGDVGGQDSAQGLGCGYRTGLWRGLPMRLKLAQRLAERRDLEEFG